MKKFYTIAALLSAAFTANAQVTVTPAGSASNISSFLTGYGITISNTIVNCHPNGVGYFAASNNNLGIVSGLALTTGSIFDLPGPNTNFASTNNSYPGDAAFNSVSAPYTTFDACILEFDCVPAYDTLYFNFIFGSEEYPEFVNTGFNDAFAIFISGPSIVGGMQNIAYIPNTYTPITINNVNAGMNSQYFVDNTLPNNGNEPSYDGFTTNIQATIPVVPQATYHMKIGVADASDEIYDCGVFLQGGSFRTMDPNLTTGIKETADYNVLAYPQPANDVIHFSFGNASMQNAAVNIYNSIGELVSSEKIDDITYAYNTSSLAEGVYYAQFMVNGSMHTKKFVVQK
jgi:hypothetical protein